MRACVRYTHTYTRVYARKLVCVFVHACMCVSGRTCVYSEYYTRMRICHTSVGENVRFSICKRATVCAVRNIMHK